MKKITYTVVGNVEKRNVDLQHKAENLIWSFQASKVNTIPFLILEKWTIFKGGIEIIVQKIIERAKFTLLQINC